MSSTPVAGRVVAVRDPATTSRSLRVIVADEDAGFRHSLCDLVAADRRFTVCAHAADAPAAIRLALDTEPDVCLLEVALPGSGVGAAAELSARLPLATIVMLSDSDDEADLFAALRAGAAGYLLKETMSHDLTDRLREAVDAGATLSPPLLARLIERFRDPNALRRTIRTPGVQLTSREWQLLELIRAGHSTAVIAQRLCLAQATVRSHRARIARKLRPIEATAENELREYTAAAPHTATISGAPAVQSTPWFVREAS
jgi:DNA-binding NarL/FixJ family response regulator